MQKCIVLISLIWLLVGCIGDPVGITERTQIRANATVAVAQAERDAAIGVAEAEASKSQAWALVIIPALLIVIGGAIVGVIVWWQGRIYYARVTRQVTQPLTFTVCSRQDLISYARRHGGQLAIDDHGYKVYLPDGQVQRLLPVRDGG